MDKLLELMNATDDKEFKLAVLEAIGDLVLMIHWLRGTFNWMMHTGAVEWPSAEDKANYERLFGNIEVYESFVWEIAPSRAALLQLREYRRTGTIMEGFEKLFDNKDPHGRLPFDTTIEDLDDIKDLLRRLGEARIAAGDTDVELHGIREGVESRK